MVKVGAGKWILHSGIFGMLFLSLLVSCGGNDGTTSPFSEFSAPVAEFSASPTTGNAPLNVAFSDMSTGGSVTLWFWDFGDGGTSTEQDPSHDYATSGTYTVSLTVTGPNGSDTITKVDYITVTLPIFTDDFNRADANPIGGFWEGVASFNNLQIVSNEARGVLSGQRGAAYYNVPISPDQYSRAKITGGGNYRGVFCRTSPNAATMYAIFVSIGTPTTLTLARVVDNVETDLAQPSVNVSVGDTLELRATGIGSVVHLEALVNGVVVTSYDDTHADRILNGYPGLYSGGDTQGMDDWEGGELQ